MDGRERDSKAVRQCRARRHPDRRGPQFLPELEEPARGDGAGLAFHPGGFWCGNRPGHRGVDAGPFDLRRVELTRRTLGWKRNEHASRAAPIRARWSSTPYDYRPAWLTVR